MKLNGNLVLNAAGTSEIQNAFLERLSAVPVHDPSDEGRLVYNTTTNLYYFHDGSGWVPFATGGNAAQLAEEVDNIETSLGDGIDSNGEFVGFGSDAIIGDAESFTEALTLLSAAVAGHDTLAELEDVTLTTPSQGQFLMKGATDWVNHTLVLADVSDVTASAAEVNILDGATLTTTELNYVDGVTSSIQDQLDAKQDEDATLTALAAFNTNGILVQTAADTFAGRTLQAPAAGITITNPAGTAGDPTFALANDLAALEGLTGTGYVIRTGDGTATTRSIAGTADNIVVTNGDGVSSDTSIDLATVTNPGNGGNFVKVSTDAYGRVTNSVAVSAADIEALVDASYVNIDGDTMEGALNMGNNVISGLAPGVAGTDAVNKNQLDALNAGLSWKQAVRVATTGPVDLSEDLAEGEEIDGITLVAGDRVLVKDQTDASENGIYIVPEDGAAARSVDLDDAADFAAATVFVTEGDVNADTGWTQTAEVATVDTDDVDFAQFTGAGTYMAGVGLELNGNTFDVLLGAGIAALPSSEVGIELYDSVNGAIVLTVDGSARSTASASKLHLLLDAAGGLAQTSAGLKINAASVTNAMLANQAITFNTDENDPDAVNLGETVQIIGTSTQGITTNGPSDNTIQISAANASASQKGVASFDATEFDVTDGNVELGTVPYTKLSVSTIQFIGDSGSANIGLNDTVTFDGDAAQGVSTAVSGSTVAITVADATVSAKGVASFDSNDFSVTSGAVSLVAKDLDSLTDVGVTAPASGDTLVYNDAENEFQNKPIYFLYDGVSDDQHVVEHNLGQKYCNVTVVDATDEVIIPESITFNSANQLTVTFTTAIACKIVVMGVPQL